MPDGEAENKDESKVRNGDENKENKISKQSDIGGNKSGSKKDTGVEEGEQNEITLFLDIFAYDTLLEGCIPIFLSLQTQQIFRLKIDEDISALHPVKCIQKKAILDDIEKRAAVSEFSINKGVISDYSGTELVIVLDEQSKFGQNFLLATTEESKQIILNPPPKQDHENFAGNQFNEDDEAGDEVNFYEPSVSKPWVSFGSEFEIYESNYGDTRSKVVTIYQRERREFGSHLVLKDQDSYTKGTYSEVVCYEDKAYNIVKTELDRSVSNTHQTAEHGCNTDWKYPRNAITQYYPRTLSADKILQILAPGGPCRNIKHIYKYFEFGLQQNMMFDYLSDDFAKLGFGDDKYDTRADNTFKEFLSFTDLKYSKDKAVTHIQWHPTLKGIVAISVAEKLNYSQRAEQLSRILNTPSYIMLWSFADPIQPQLLLEAPDDIMCFQINLTDPHIVAGGCVNGQVVLWDISKHLSDLANVRDRIMAKNKPPLFSFDDTDPNKVVISPYCALSSIEHSHSKPILDLQWVPDHFEVNRMGYAMENNSSKCVQLMTCAIDNEILFWDIRADRSPLTIDKTRDAIVSPIGVPATFQALDLKWKPLFKVHLFGDSGVDHSPTTICIKDDKGAPSAKPSSGKARMLQGVSTFIYAGTEDGDLLYVDWMPHKDQETGKMITPKPDFYVQQHDGPICFLARSPFDSSIFLAVGGWTWSLWREGIHTGALLSSAQSAKPLTGGSWSPTRSSVFYLTRADGSIEVWDLLNKTHEPAMLQSVSASSLTSICLWNTASRQLIAVGDAHGALQILIVPPRLRKTSAAEQASFVAYIECEVKRHQYVLQRWSMREQEKIEKEVEAKRKAGIAPTAQLSADEIAAKQKAEYEVYLSEEMTFLRELCLVEDD